MKPSAFDNLHPLVTVTYFVAVLVLVMSAFHPVLLGCALFAGFAWNAWLRGLKDALGTTAWELPLLAIIALANPFFSGAGSTKLFVICDQPLYLESLVYGLCMGIMLVAVLQWFSNASRVVTSDKLMQVLAPLAPTITLMITMVGRLVPQFVRRGQTIDTAEFACTSAMHPTDGTQTKSLQRSVLQRRLRQVTVLMGWSMEDSLESADAMRARGWGATANRTTYRRRPFTKRDALQLAELGVLIVLAAIGAWQLCAGFKFYATLHGTWCSPWLIPYLALLVLPLALELIEQLRWRYRERTTHYVDDTALTHPSRKED